MQSVTPLDSKIFNASKIRAAAEEFKGIQQSQYSGTTTADKDAQKSLQAAISTLNRLADFETMETWNPTFAQYAPYFRIEAAEQAFKVQRAFIYTPPQVWTYTNVLIGALMYSVPTGTDSGSSYVDALYQKNQLQTALTTSQRQVQALQADINTRVQAAASATTTASSCKSLEDEVKTLRAALAAQTTPPPPAQKETAPSKPKCHNLATIAITASVVATVCTVIFVCMYLTLQKKVDVQTLTM